MFVPAVWSLFSVRCGAKSKPRVHDRATVIVALVDKARFHNIVQHAMAVTKRGVTLAGRRAGISVDAFA